MGVIFEREFKALLRNIKAVVCIAVFVFLSGLFFAVNNLSAGYAGMQSVLSGMSLAAALLIPLVASGAISKERKKGTDALLDAMPVTRAQIVLGKFFAVLAFFMIPTAVMAIYPLILSSMGGAPMLQGYIMLLIFVVFQAFFVAFCIMISSLCKKTWVATVISYAAIAVLFVLGMIAALFEGFFEDALKFISPFRRFDPTVFDLLDLSSLIFYASFIALFLWIAAACCKKQKAYSQRARSEEKRVAVISAVLTVALLGLNASICFLPSTLRQLDISADGAYSISDGTKKYLSDIDDEITVYLLDPISSEEKLHNYIRRYCETSDKITLKEIYTAEDTEFLSKYGMTSDPTYYSMVIESKKTGRWKLVTSDEYFSYYNGTYKHMSPSDYESAVSYYSQMYSYYSQSSSYNEEYLSTAQEALYTLSYETSLCLDAEETITTAIEYVRAEYVPTLYFSEGHGEKNTSANPLDIGEIDEIPEDASLIVINDPDEDYSAEEIAILQDYSDNGGRLIIITDQSINGKANLSRLLATFGLSAEEGVVGTDGETDVEATVDLSSEALEAMPFETMEISGGSSIIASDVEELDFSALLTAKVSTSEDKTEEKVLAMSVSRDGAEKLIWFTGADSFNRDTADMSDEEKEEYTKAAYCIQGAVSWLWVPFASELDFPDANEYEAAMLIAESGTATWIGVIFIGIIPLSIIGAALLNLYARKKRSRAVKVSE